MGKPQPSDPTQKAAQKAYSKTVRKLVWERWRNDAWHPQGFLSGLVLAGAVAVLYWVTHGRSWAAMGELTLWALALPVVLVWLTWRWVRHWGLVHGELAVGQDRKIGQLAVEVAELRERLTPKLSLAVPRFPQWRWIYQDLPAICGGGRARYRFPVVEVVNDSGATVKNVRAQIADVQPSEVTIDTPYPLQWFVAESRPTEDVLAEIPAGGNAFIAFPAGMGRNLMQQGSPILVVRVWGEQSFPDERSFRFHRWKYSEYPFIHEPDEDPNEAWKGLVGIPPEVDEA